MTHKDGEMQCCSEPFGFVVSMEECSPILLFGCVCTLLWRGGGPKFCICIFFHIDLQMGFASCRFSHFGIHVPLNFYNFNPNFSLPVLLKVSFGPYRGMLDCSGLLLGILSRHVSCLNRIKNAIERVQTPQNGVTKNQAQKAILFGSVLGGQKGVISLSSA